MKNKLSLLAGDPTSDRATQLKKDWNSYQLWLKSKGLAGKPELDKGVGDQNLGMQYVKQYKKENPASLVSPETIAEVQGHFKNYRDYAIQQLREKKAMLNDPKNPNGRYVAPDENLDFFMKDLSKVDNIPGSKTTSWQFPPSFLTTIYKDPKGQIEKKEVLNTGLAAVQ